MNKYIYTLIRFEKQPDFSKRFIYNETKYNLLELGNNFNKFFDIKLKEIDFFKKKNTMPIWAFRFNEENKINLFRDGYLFYDICALGGSTLIIYKLDDIDNKNMKTVNNAKLQLLKSNLNDSKNMKKIMSVKDVKINNKIQKQLDLYNNKLQLFNNNDVYTKNVILPRLRTKNIVGMINPANLMKTIYTKSISEQQFIDLLKTERMFFNINI